MSEMVERVAQAMVRLFGTATYVDCARAAVEAMREPTPEMVAAGAWAICADRLSVTGAVGATDAWRRMIDAALAD